MGILTEFVRVMIDAGVQGQDLIDALERVENKLMQDRVSSSQDRSRGYRPSGRSGPLQRWGYEGPQTPRLSEKEWWPLRGTILRRDNYTCRYCCAQDEIMCADHVIPLSRGGSNDPENLVAACMPCNSSKADKLLSEWGGRSR